LANCQLSLEALKAAEDEVLTLSETASWLRLNETDVAAAAARGEIPGRQVVGTWRFSRPLLLIWLAGVEQPAECLLSEVAGGPGSEPPPPPATTLAKRPDQVPLLDAGLPPEALAAIAGAGAARAGAERESRAPAPAETEVGPVAEEGRGGQAGTASESFGAAPDLETARELALRGETVLGRQGALQLEADLAYSRREALVGFSPPAFSVEQEQETVAGALTVRYATTDRLQLSLGGSVARFSSTLNDGTRDLIDGPARTEFGDVRLGASYQVLNETAAWPSVFVSGEGSLPTDGSGSYGLNATLALTKRFDPTTLFGSLGYLHVFNAEKRGLRSDQVAMNFGFVFSMNDRLAFRTALGGRFLASSTARDVALRSDEQFDLSFSMPSVLSERFSLEPRVSFGLDDGPGNRFTLGLSLISNLGTYQLP
jgi:hypothetical protein